MNKTVVEDREEQAVVAVVNVIGTMLFGILIAVIAGFIYSGTFDSSGEIPEVRCGSKLRQLSETTITGKRARDESWNKGIYDTCDRLEYVQNELAKDRGETTRMSSR